MPTRGAIKAVAWKTAAPAALGYVYVTLNYTVLGRRAYAYNVAGTGLVLVGENYFRLHPLARAIIDAHEDLHTRQGPFYNRNTAEIEAYHLQYQLASELIDNWECRTGGKGQYVPGGKAWNDVIGLQMDARDQLMRRAPHLLQ